MIEQIQAREFYKEQLDYLFAKDVDGLIDNHYNEDAVLIGFDFVVKGRDALKAHFRTYLQMLGHFEVKSTNKFRETEDTLFFEASVVSDLGPAEVYDALVLKDGKIVYHFTGVK
jgi:ketosteroid isomerase-like protein